MGEKNDQMDKVDDVMLPGFRFHPTDEELVGFYLKRKIQQRLLPIELIKQVDIYKYDPWDLPKLASTGEKEWYFYCPRDRKYRNSARPNRVTGAGFWKATGTDRPIYSSEGSKCIGLKKSHVFYRGRAAKGIKTDWMMHEFRLPSIADSSPPKKLLDKSLPPNDAWAICRIFKKTNSMAQRALSQSWLSPLPEPTSSGFLTQCPQFSSENNISCTTDLGSAIQFWSNNNDLQHQQASTYSAFDALSYKPNFNPALVGENIPNGFMFTPIEMSSPPNFNHALVGDLSNNNTSGSIDFDGSQQQQFSGFSTSLAQDQNQENTNTSLANNTNSHWGTIRSIGFPFSLGSDDPSDMSTSYSTNKCYT
ncbi:hypothetical protein ACLB2K_058036 [Fragaria x ananassa]